MFRLEKKIFFFHSAIKNIITIKSVISFIQEQKKNIYISRHVAVCIFAVLLVCSLNAFYSRTAAGDFKSSTRF